MVRHGAMSTTRGNSEYVSVRTGWECRRESVLPRAQDGVEIQTGTSCNGFWFLLLMVAVAIIIVVIVVTVSEFLVIGKQIGMDWSIKIFFVRPGGRMDIQNGGWQQGPWS